ncbi:isochorismatase domain-containing protein 1 [Egretta garzetta]|nr:isochorismatase domain-containing protein 1 [Egretta garzetta]
MLKCGDALHPARFAPSVDAVAGPEPRRAAAEDPPAAQNLTFLKNPRVQLNNRFRHRESEPPFPIQTSDRAGSCLNGHFSGSTNRMEGGLTKETGKDSLSNLQKELLRVFNSSKDFKTRICVIWGLHCHRKHYFVFQMTTLGNLTPSSTVFFCCDMQERFRPAIKYFGDIISVGQRLLQGARLLGIPVIVTEQYPKGLGSTVQEIDLTGAKLVLPKTKFSMVLPEVEAALAEIPGVRSVVLFGVETHVCIQQTALELIGRGLEVHIVADATSSRSMMDRMFALERLARTGIIVTTSEAILLQLVADKEHPKFKEIQNLIKASAPESGLLSKV